jgi:AcrR family transcriptional regulator
MLLNQETEIKIDPRVKRTQALIQQAFADLLAEKGFQSITVQDITQRAEINRATFYAHFPDKFALLENHIQQVFRAELEKRTLHACHYSEDNLQALIVTVIEFIGQANTRCKSLDSQFELMVERQVRKQIQEILVLWISKVGADIETQTAATASSWTIYGLALQHNQDKRSNKPSSEAFAKQVLPLVRDNLHLQQKKPQA